MKHKGDGNEEKNCGIDYVNDIGSNIYSVWKQLEIRT